jgi:hypothetical protein
MNTALRTVLATGIISISFAGCTSKQPANTATSTPVDVGASASPSIKPVPSVKVVNASHSALMTAAEPFEALTEQAATATPAVLDKLIGEARSAADGASATLDPTQKDRLASQLADITAAQKAGDHTAIALASVEAYRTLVESATDTGMSSRAVSLLDYSGFRYQVNLAAKPARWAEAQAAVDFADTQWAALSPKIADASLQNQVSSSIAEMRKATQAKDPVLAKSASTTELDLVDKLEAYLAAK